MISLTTGVRGTVNLPLSPSRKTWKHRRTAFRSIEVGWFRWLNPAGIGNKNIKAAAKRCGVEQSSYFWTDRLGYPHVPSGRLLCLSFWRTGYPGLRIWRSSFPEILPGCKLPACNPLVPPDCEDVAWKHFRTEFKQLSVFTNSVRFRFCKQDWQNWNKQTSPKSLQLFRRSANIWPFRKQKEW